MFEVMVIGAWCGIIATLLVVLYLAYKEYTRAEPVSKEDLKSLSGAFESTMNIVAREIGEDRKKELFESELRTYDRFRRQFEKHSPNT
jgi:hypothetical protein